MKTRAVLKNINNTLAAAAAVWLVLAWIPATRGTVLALSEYAYGDTLPIFPNGNCRIKNSDIASRKPGAIVVLGEVVGAGQYGKHVWAIDANGQTIDEVCPPESQGCTPRVAYAVINDGGDISSSNGSGKADVMISYELTRRALRAWL